MREFQGPLPGQNHERRTQGFVRPGGRGSAPRHTAAIGQEEQIPDLQSTEQRHIQAALQLRLHGEQ